MKIHHNLSQIDIHGVLRSSCSNCTECPQFVSIPGHVLCAYCGCPPAKHGKADSGCVLVLGSGLGTSGLAPPVAPGEMKRGRDGDMNAESMEEEEHLVQETPEQVLMFQQDKVLLTEGGEPMLVKKQTPVKILPVRIKNWNDERKLQLLKLYIIQANDPRARDTGGPSSRRVVRAQLEPIYAKESVVIDGEQVRLDVMNYDNLTRILACNGLTKQERGRGLVHIIDEFLARQEDNQVNLRERVDEVMEFAMKYCRDK